MPLDHACARGPESGAAQGDTGAEPVETVFAEHFILCTGAAWRLVL